MIVVLHWESEECWEEANARPAGGPSFHMLDTLEVVGEQMGRRMWGSGKATRRHKLTKLSHSQLRFSLYGVAKMALVNYSDSETSDTEATVAPATPKLTPPTKVDKVIDRAEGRKIKIDLPAVHPEPSERADEPAAKRARTTGAFSGFNSLLPAPKKAATQNQNGLKKGVSLKTSSEAAFSRQPVQTTHDGEEEGRAGSGNGGRGAVDTEPAQVVAEEPKMVGRATKFKPLSVGNRKKPVKRTKAAVGIDDDTNGTSAQESSAQTNEQGVKDVAPPPPKPKRSLFSVPAEEAGPSADVTTAPYESLMEQHETADVSGGTDHQTQQPGIGTPAQSNPNSLHSIASDLNLTPAQRRQLFGRHAKDSEINIAHFNMDNEYAANEQLRQAGEVVEHRAVKAIAPGKHSLQQLVNNARSQQDAMEDKWADGRREKGESGKSYGWGK